MNYLYHVIQVFRGKHLEHLTIVLNNALTLKYVIAKFLHVNKNFHTVISMTILYCMNYFFQYNGVIHFCFVAIRSDLISNNTTIYNHAV
jgi:hypothetical protein